MPLLKKALWGSVFWSSGFHVNTVRRYGNEAGTRHYIIEQGLPDYQPLYEAQLSLFDQTDEATHS